MADEQKPRRGRPRKLDAVPTYAKWIPDNADPQKEFTDEDQMAFARQVISLYRITAKKSRDRIAAAIEDGRIAETLTPGERILRDQIATVYVLNPEMRDEVKEILGIDPNKVEGYIHRTLLDMGGDEQYLSGLEPPEEEQIAKIAQIVEQGYIKLPDASGRGSSKLDRRASYFPNTGDETIPLKLDSSTYEIKMNVIRKEGEPLQMITPYDQEVEMAVSNFVEKCFSSPQKMGHYMGFPATLEQIYCIMNGTEPGTYISKGALEDLEKSIRKNSRTEIEITEIKDGETINKISGRILDAIELVQTKIHTGHIKRGFAFTRLGLLYTLEKNSGRLLNVTKEQLNISRGYWRTGLLEAGEGKVSQTKKTGDSWQHIKLSITPLSIVIRAYLIKEIFRIRNMGTLDPRGNKITYDALIKFEASPELVEYGDNGLPRTVEGKPEERILKQWITPKEKKIIENARDHRRKLAINILGHFMATGFIKSFRETSEGRKKTGVIIEVDKTQRALKEIKKSEDLKRYNRKGKK